MNTPTLQAFALLAFHNENNPHVPSERASDGYLAQEIQRLKKL